MSENPSQSPKNFFKKRILYFGIFDPDFSRNKVYADGLRQNGYEVIICVDRSRGIKKYFSLFIKHWKFRHSYDAMIVGYPGYIIVPFARLITRKKIIFDALCSFYETEIISRDAYKGNPFRIPYVRLIDWIATTLADKILVETEEQKKYFEKELGVSASKLVVAYTGVDECAFILDPGIKKYEKFTVLFRGRIMREAGVANVIKAAKLLEKEDLQFVIVGFGRDQAMKDFCDTLAALRPANLKYIGKQVPITELRQIMQKSHVSLGQFANNERLKRTIPHKAFESMLLRIPYVTSRAQGVSEILTDRINCLMVKQDDPEDLADKIVKLKNDRALVFSLAENAFKLYREKFEPAKIVEPIIKLLSDGLFE